MCVGLLTRCHAFDGKPWLWETRYWPCHHVEPLVETLWNPLSQHAIGHPTPCKLRLTTSYSQVNSSQHAHPFPYKVPCTTTTQPASHKHVDDVNLIIKYSSIHPFVPSIYSSLMPQSHQTFCLVRAMELVGIMLRSRIWHTTSHTITNPRCRWMLFEPAGVINPSPQHFQVVKADKYVDRPTRDMCNHTNFFVILHHFTCLLTQHQSIGIYNWFVVVVEVAIQRNEHIYIYISIQF